jgi:hypothetical protein
LHYLPDFADSCGWSLHPLSSEQHSTVMIKKWQHGMFDQSSFQSPPPWCK